jgi:hypothetical protein
MTADGFGGVSGRSTVGLSLASVSLDSNDSLLPSRSPSREKNLTDSGAISSCSVQPLVKHLLDQKAAFQVVVNE